MYTIMGAAGNISGKLTRLLLEKNQKVRIIGRSMERLQHLIDSGAEAAVGDAADSDFLAEAFKDAYAVYTMIPVNYTATDYRSYQNEIGQSIATAIKRSGVTHVVNLSSLGAHLPDKTGPIKGLHDQEQRLNKLEDTNILHLRPTFFMENMLENIDMIKNMGLNGGHIKGDMPFAMIATSDIARVAMLHILERDFSGNVVRELLGPRDISMKEATRIIGEKIGIPDLMYVHFSRDDYIKGLTQAGLTNDMAQLLAEMSAGLNDIQFGTGLTRTEENTTPTTFEEFAEFFAQVYNS
jgi:uncharacterized protein YbjT (DUF2867 family)